MVNLFKKYFGKKPIFYNSIEDLPVFNWFKIHETQDFSYLIKNREEARKYDENHINEIWLKIYSEYLDNFGFNDRFKAYLEAKRELEILKIDYSITKDQYFLTFIEVKEAEIKKEFDKHTKGDYLELKAYLEKFMGFKLNISEVSVKEYYNYLVILTKENEQRKKTALNNGGRN